MVRNTLMALAGSTALLFAGSVLAAPGGHGGGMGGAAGPAGSTASMHSQGPMNASPTGISHASPNSVLSGAGTGTTNPTTGGTSYNPNSPAAQNSQALQHASPTGIAHASPNSVLARGAVPTTSLTGIAPNMTVTNSTGTLGTVSQIIYGPGQSTIRGIVVTSPTGQTYTIPANALTISGGAITTTYGG